MVSEPFKATQPSSGEAIYPQVSATEALWWVALQARSNWKWAWPAADPDNLLDGSFILGHDLRNRRL
ncbi:hypothetical protein BDV24DRAFT_137070 [Aspergillus arachidicola]|uniref:Uncharacterized protein n=1 Tax=Aspergillus arachidicola TaxID=656916 RepID=A0A5N6Y0B2_9EURO|nr:hypothetical protein BDV24DRAFT_137070 [Aspergillus arachidicola]